MPEETERISNPITNKENNCQWVKKFFTQSKYLDPDK